MDLKYYTLTEIGKITGLSHTTLLAQVKAGKIKAVKFAGKGKWRVSQQDLDDYLNGQSVIRNTAVNGESK